MVSTLGSVVPLAMFILKHSLGKIFLELTLFLLRNLSSSLPASSPAIQFLQVVPIKCDQTLVGQPTRSRKLNLNSAINFQNLNLWIIAERFRECYRSKKKVRYPKKIVFVSLSVGPTHPPHRFRTPKVRVLTLFRKKK